MPYQGAYQGQYGSYPGYNPGQQPMPQYHQNGVQYPLQQQPMPPAMHQTYQPQMNGDIYSKQYYQPQPQPQQQTPYVDARATQYNPAYHPQNPQPSQHLSFQQSAPRPQQVPQRLSQYQVPSPVIQQQPPYQQQYQQQQQQHHHSVAISPQWPNHMGWNNPSVQAAPSNVAPGRPSSGQMQRPSPASQVPRQAPTAASPVVSHHVLQNAPSSPDPLAPSPNLSARQAQPPQATPAQQQRQSRLSQPVAAKPKPNVAPSFHTPQHRIASHVEIPVMSQPTKRRRSNEGTPVPVCDGPSVDYQAALLALSDEYISAAYSLDRLDTDEQLQEYHALIATGIGCLESVLKNYRHADARKEGRIRLRLATLLVEETENDMEAEETLSKGIALCERSRLVDLKYAMHHVLARLMFKKSPKAALKAIEKLIQEVEPLRLLHWMYAFRLLRVCFGMQISGHSETAAMLKHLAAMSAIADEHRHVSMQIVVATLETLVHLRSGTPDATDLAQRALASARTHQLGPEMKSMPQIRALLECLDLSCSLVSFEPATTLEKMNQMHANMDPATRQSGWSKDGTFAIPMVPSSNADLDLDTAGIMKINASGMASLNLRLMSQSGIYVIGYLLSGITFLHKDEDGKAQSFLREGHKLNTQSARAQRHQQSLGDRSVADEQHAALDIAARLLMIFEFCGRFDWEKARAGINQTRDRLGKGSSEVPQETMRMLLYQDAVCKQAEGDINGALRLFQSQDLAFEVDMKYESGEKDLRVLSALNSIMILRGLGSEHADKASSLHAAIESHCSKHPNKSFNAAYFVTKATANDSNTAITKTKSYLQSAVTAAKSAGNNQLLFIVMNIMTDLFFHSIIGDQAEKSAQAGRTLAKRGGNSLWVCVADGMFGDIKETCGKPAEAHAARQEGMTSWEGLPKGLKERLTLHGNAT